MNKGIIRTLYPPATLGVIGGGQLGRMFVMEAKRMGYHVVVLDPKENSPAGQVADEQIVAGFDELWAFQKLADRTDVITYEFEHIDAGLLSLMEENGARVYPSSKTLKTIQNKYVQKTMLRRAGVKVPEFEIVNDLNGLRELFAKFKREIILKSCTKGYDGKGNIVVKNERMLEAAYQHFKGLDLMAEELIEYEKEVSIVFSKNDSELLFYPIAENRHEASILIRSWIPAGLPAMLIDEIHMISKKIADELQDYGIFCIEFFIDKNNHVLVNEIAPRPHNSGHYTIEACITSQYEQLVRILCGLPMGSTDLIMPSAMYNILGNSEVTGEYQVKGIEHVLRLPNCYLHLYGKPMTGNLKKIGHITALGETVEAADVKARAALKQVTLCKKDV